MRAREHTQTMLTWWRRAGIDRVDLALRRASGAMVWHHDLAEDTLPLAWASAQNVRGAEVYIRPARQYAWPLVFLDDVSTPRARSVAGKYEALVVGTSRVGGCHIWMACRQPLEETSRYHAQHWLARRIQADLGSISGEHLGRLAGFKNWKRGGTWVNVLAASRHGRRWDAGSVVPIDRSTSPGQALKGGSPRSADTSPSGREWGWVCGLLENGCSPEGAYARLLEHSRARRGRDAPRYARRTVERALQRVGSEAIHRVGDHERDNSNHILSR